MEIDLEVPESIDFSEFPVSESVEKKHQKHKGKHQKEVARTSEQKWTNQLRQFPKESGERLRRKSGRESKMPALPPKLGKNPTPEEIDQYREQLEEYEKVLTEKEQAQKEAAKEQEEREAENTRAQARLEKWKQQLTVDSEKSEADREGFGAQRERLDIDIEKLRIDTKAQETQKKELEEWEKTLKVEQAKIDVLKEEGLPPAGGLDPAIILQQKQLLEKYFNQNQATTNLVAR